MILSGSPFSHEVYFDTGLPSGNFLYSLLGNDGLPISGYDNVSVAVPNGAVSLTINIPGGANTVSTPLFEGRTLVWSYPTLTGTVTNRVKYRVDRDIPFPVSCSSVRAKLGVEPHEVPDGHIRLLDAYAYIASLYAPNAIDAYAADGDRNTLIITNAIEAAAALALIPAMQLSVAKSEDSGTNSYERFSGMDWEMLAASLNGYLTELALVIPPLTDPFLGFTIFFAVARSPDPLTGVEVV